MLNTEKPHPEALAIDSRLYASIDWLVSTHATVSVEGVSQGDMATLNAIAATLVADTIPEDQISAESYSTTMFTEERSSVNLDLALEGFVSALGRAIEKVIRAMVDAIEAMYKGLKKTVEAEAITRLHAKKLYNAVGTASEGADQLSKKFLRDTSGPQTVLDQYRKELLESTLVKHTDLQKALLGDTAQLRKVKRCVSEVVSATEAFETYFGKVRQVMGSATASTEALANDPVFDRILHLSWEVDDYLKIHKDKDVLSTHTGLTYFDKTPKAQVKRSTTLSELAPYADQLDHFGKLDKQLKQIWKSNMVGDSAELKPVLAGLNRASTALDQLSKLTRFLYRYNQTVVNTLKVMYRFENKRFTLYHKLATEVVITEVQKESLRKTRDKYTQLLATLVS